MDKSRQSYAARAWKEWGCAIIKFRMALSMKMSIKIPREATLAKFKE